jgi:iron complex transport system substrate-binding protein
MQAFAFVSAISLLLSGAAHAAAPRRVASLNLCTDELLLMLAAPGQIVSVTHLAQQPAESTLWRRARAYRRNDGSLLSVASMRPDLVLTMGGGARDRVGIAKRLGIRTVDLPFPQSISDIETSIAKVAAALGRRDAGSGLIQQLRALKQTAPLFRADTIWLGGGGRSAAADGLTAQWMALAGLRQRSLVGDRVSLEQLLVRPPRILLRLRLPKRPVFRRAKVAEAPPRARQGEIPHHRHGRPRLDLHGAALDPRDPPPSEGGSVKGRGTLLVTAALVGVFLLAVMTPFSALRELSRQDQALAWAVIVELRLPRALLALIYGAMLGASERRSRDCSPTRSPRRPHGTTSGAALGAVLTAYTFASRRACPVARIGGGRARGLAAAPRSGGRQAETTTLLLSGLAISALAGALTTLALALASSPSLLRWLRLAAGFARRSQPWPGVLCCRPGAPFRLPCCSGSGRAGQPHLGEEVAISSGTTSAACAAGSSA